MSAKQSSEEILSSHKLKSTACRKTVLNELLESETAMTEQEIKDVSGNLFDRVTFYRTLRTLEAAGIIHSIILDNNQVKYAISDMHQDTVHSHFHCIKCNEVQCLNDDAIDVKIALPPGFKTQSLDVMINGICNHCN